MYRVTFISYLQGSVVIVTPTCVPVNLQKSSWKSTFLRANDWARLGLAALGGLIRACECNEGDYVGMTCPLQQPRLNSSPVSLKGPKTGRISQQGLLKGPVEPAAEVESKFEGGPSLTPRKKTSSKSSLIFPM